MKKLISVILSAMILTTTLTACGGSPKTPTGSANGGEKDAYKITIVQPMSHTSLDQIRDTIVAELGNSGENIVIDTKNANGDSTALSTILENCKAEGVDLVIPIATSTAQSAKAVFDGTGTPIVFAAVSDPAAAGLTGEDCQNITGVSNNRRDREADFQLPARLPEDRFPVHLQRGQLCVHHRRRQGLL